MHRSAAYFQYRDLFSDDSLYDRYFACEADTVFHYTTQQALLNIVSSRELWFTHIRFLNDQSEIEHACGLFLAITSKRIKRRASNSLAYGISRGIRERIEKRQYADKYVLCFSTKSDDLNQWRSYASPGAGYCMGFSATSIQKLLKDWGGQMATCLYNEADQVQVLEGILDKATLGLEEYFPYYGHNEINGDLTEAKISECMNQFWTWAPYFKNSVFSDESEIRVVIEPPESSEVLGFRSGASVIIPILKLPMNVAVSRSLLPDRILIKPTTSPDLAIRGLKMLCARENFPMIAIDVSKIPYRETI